MSEASLLMHNHAAAQFLYRLAKSARKHWCGLTVVTQDAADLLGSDLGQAVLANAATKLFMKQDPATIDTVVETFRLSPSERQFLLAAGKGEGLFFARGTRAALKIEACETEHRLATTAPQELAARGGHAARAVRLAPGVPPGASAADRIPGSDAPRRQPILHTADEEHPQWPAR